LPRSIQRRWTAIGDRRRPCGRAVHCEARVATLTDSAPRLRRTKRWPCRPAKDPPTSVEDYCVSVWSLLRRSWRCGGVRPQVQQRRAAWLANHPLAVVLELLGHQVIQV